MSRERSCEWLMCPVSMPPEQSAPSDVRRCYARRSRSQDRHNYSGDGFRAISPRFCRSPCTLERTAGDRARRGGRCVAGPRRTNPIDFGGRPRTQCAQHWWFLRNPLLHRIRTFALTFSSSCVRVRLFADVSTSVYLRLCIHARSAPVTDLFATVSVFASVFPRLCFHACVSRQCIPSVFPPSRSQVRPSGSVQPPPPVHDRVLEFDRGVTAPPNERSYRVLHPLVRRRAWRMRTLRSKVAARWPTRQSSSIRSDVLRPCCIRTTELPSDTLAITKRGSREPTGNARFVGAELP